MKRSLPSRAGTGLAALTALLLASACGSGSSESPTEQETGGAGASPVSGFVGELPEAGDPVEGGTVTVAEYSEPAVLDPARTLAFGSTGGNVLVNLYDPLTKVDPKTGEVTPQLAKSLEPNEDNTVYTLTLREGVSFTDGTPMDAEAVVASIQRYIENHGSDAYLMAMYLDSMEATSADTVTFKFKRPWAHFPTMLSTGMGMILAPAAYADPEAFEPIGAGPFKLLRHAPAEELVIEANPDYWGEKPHLDEVRFIWPGGADARMDILEQGQAQVAYVKEPAQLESAVADGHVGHMAYTSSEFTLNLNHREGYPTADPRIRKAIQLAIDPELVFERVYQGAGFPTKALFGEDSKWFSGEVPPVDAEQAKKLVAEAEADGVDPTIEYFSTQTPEGRAQALAVKALLENVGITVDVVYASSVGQLVQKVYVDHDFDLTTGGAQRTDAEAVIRVDGSLRSTSVATNAGGYASKEMDGLLDELQAASTEDEIQAVIDQITELFVKDVPYVVLGAGQTFYPQSEELHGVERTSHVNLMFHDAWLAE